MDWTLDCILDWILDRIFGLDFVRMAQKACQMSLYLCLSGCLWERREVATLRSAGGGWGSILQDYFCWGNEISESGCSWHAAEQSVCRRLLQFAVWLSYKTDFVSVMTTLCVKFSADDGLYPTGLFLRISEPWSLDGSGTERASC